MRHPELKIETLKRELSVQEFEQVLAIILHYFPKPEECREILKQHLADANIVVVAKLRGKLIGINAATFQKRLTPVYTKPIPVIYQHLLFVDPECMYRGLGRRLVVATLRKLLGWFWIARRFAIICRTQNPAVAHMLSSFSEVYPKPDGELPPNIRAFGEALLPVLHASELDAQGRLIGSLAEFKGFDHTDIWNTYYANPDEPYEKTMLERVFYLENGRIINSGDFIFMFAYAKPWIFLRYLFH